MFDIYLGVTFFGIIMWAFLCLIMGICMLVEEDYTRKQVQTFSRRMLAMPFVIAAWPVIVLLALGYGISRFVPFLFERID